MNQIYLLILHSMGKVKKINHHYMYYTSQKNNCRTKCRRKTTAAQNAAEKQLPHKMPQKNNCPQNAAEKQLPHKMPQKNNCRTKCRRKTTAAQNAAEKQLPHKMPQKMKSCFVIIKCGGYILWQLFLLRLYVLCSIVYAVPIAKTSYSTSEFSLNEKNVWFYDIQTSELVW